MKSTPCPHIISSFSQIPAISHRELILAKWGEFQHVDTPLFFVSKLFRLVNWSPAPPEILSLSPLLGLVSEDWFLCPWLSGADTRISDCYWIQSLATAGK